MRKNPDNKMLTISSFPRFITESDHKYALVLSNLAIAESNLVRAGKDSAMPHFIAIVKEIERIYGFKFEIHEEQPTPTTGIDTSVSGGDASSHPAIPSIE